MGISFVHRFKGSGFSAAAGSRSGRSYRKSDPGLAEFHMSAAAGQKNGQFNRKRNFWGSIPKSAVVGYRISQ